MSKKERHFFLHESEKHLYTVEYLPDVDQDRTCAVILCKPIWGERIRTHIIFSNLARMLIGNGFTVITCDYFGDGNSEGETRELNFFSMVEDIEILNRYLRKKYNIEKYFLVGLRLGANVAMSVEPKIDGVSKLILFEPVTNPNNLFKRALRANLATQMAIHKKILKTREQLIQDLHEDELVNIDGFVIGKKFWESFERISPFAVESTFDNPVVFYSLVPAGKKKSDYSTLSRCYKNSEQKYMEQEFVWTGWKSYVPKPQLFFEAIKSELNVAL